MRVVELDVAGGNLVGSDRWLDSCPGRLRYPAHMECGECGGVIARREQVYVVKGDEARTVYCSLPCAQLNGYVDPLHP
jgi:hypothetical protein